VSQLYEADISSMCGWKLCRKNTNPIIKLDTTIS